MKLILPQFTKSWLARPMVTKMISFGVIGLGNTIIDLAIFTLAYKVLALPLVSANLMAWTVAVSCSYVMNTLITFAAESGRVLRAKDFASFLGAGVLGVIATTTTLVLLSHIMPVFAAKLLSIVVSFAVNFTMSHLVVFRELPYKL